MFFHSDPKITHRYCAACEVDWSVGQHGIHCWNCGLMGVVGRLAKLFVPPAVPFSAPVDPPAMVL